jgi:hypothetical protein
LELATDAAMIQCTRASTAGTSQWADGSRYRGSWVKDKRQGAGAYSLLLLLPAKPTAYSTRSGRTFANRTTRPHYLAATMQFHFQRKSVKDSSPASDGDDCPCSCAGRTPHCPVPGAWLVRSLKLRLCTQGSRWHTAAETLSRMNAREKLAGQSQ